MAKKEVKRCSCGADIRFAFTADFKIGNSGQGLKSLFPLQLPKANAGILPLDVYVCEACGQVRLQAPKEIKDSLLRVARQQESNVKDKLS